METLQPPQQSDTSIVATNLASTQETDAPSYSSPLDDHETGDSNSNTQSSVDDTTAAERSHNQNDIDRDQSHSFPIKDEHEATTNLPESNNYENYGEKQVCVPIDTSEVDFATNTYHQEVEEKSQKDEGSYDNKIDEIINEKCVNENETVGGGCSKDISEAEENELLESDECDGNSSDNNPTRATAKEQEDELLKSADEDESNGPASILPKENQSDDHYSINDINNVPSTAQIQNTNVNNAEGNPSKNTKSPSDADDKEAQHRNNLRILYHFDISDESCSNDSDQLSSNKDDEKIEGIYNSEPLLVDKEYDRNQKEVSITNTSSQGEHLPTAITAPEVKSEESLVKRSPKCWSDKKLDNTDDSSKDSFESETHHSLPETTDINDFGKVQHEEKNMTKSELNTGPEICEDKLMPPSTEINKISQPESSVDVKDWHNFDNSNKSDEFMYNDFQNNNEAERKLNGDHNQHGVGHHNDTTNDSMTSETNRMKSPNTTKEYIQDKQFTPSPLFLPQNEEARATFHSETNTEVKSPIKDFDEYDKDRKVVDEYKTTLVVSEDPNQKQVEDSGNVGQFPQHISTSYEATLNKSKPLGHDDDASRSSLASSASFSTSASSSQHLVIDHPMDDIKDEIAKPVKICLKRKLSFSSEDGQSDGPQRKHISLNNEQDHPTLIRENSQHIQEKLNYTEPTSLMLDKDTPMTSYPEEKLDFGIKQEQNGLSPVPVFKSLLLQQLEKPITAPPVLKSQLYSMSAPAAPKELEIPKAAQPPLIPTNNLPLSMEKPSALDSIPPQIPVTKYICFKCKTGSFHSLAALTEHQVTCSSGHRYFNLNPPPSAIMKPSVTAAAPSLANICPAIENNSSTVLSPYLSNQKELPAVAIPKKRYYECSSCNTFHENWNLFIHIREKHNRHMCLYCTRFFPTAEKLALHLEIKHDLEQTHFNSEEALRQSIPQVENYPIEARFLMCCNCEHIFMQNEQFSQHDCAEFMKPCSLCGQKGRHTSQCKAHPDSKRFSKLKKKQDKVTTTPKSTGNDRPSFDHNIPSSAPVATHFAVNPTKTLSPNSISNCDSGRVVQRPPPNAVHSEDSDSSSNMVIDESCNANIPPPPQTLHPPAHTHIGTPSVKFDQHQKLSSSQLTPEILAEEQTDDSNKMRLPPLKLIVPKLKLRVPKEFQKSVDDDLSSSETDDGDNEEEVEVEVEAEAEDPAIISGNLNYENITSSKTDQIDLNVETTPASSKSNDVENNGATRLAAEAGNSQDDVAYESGSGDKAGKNTISLDDDDSLEEQNSNLVRIMQEIERTKMDIKRTKKTSFRQSKTFAEPLPGTLSPSSNRSNDRNWSPTPPSSPNSTWFTPRPANITQSETIPQHRLSFNQDSENPPVETETHQSDHSNTQFHPSASSPNRSHVAQERRDTIGSDMMDIDESITAQPTQTIFRNEPATNDAESLNTSTESTENEPLDSSQTTDNDETASNALSSSQPEQTTSQVNEMDKTQELQKLVVEGQTNDMNPENVHVSLAQSNEQNGNEPMNVDEDQEDDGEIDVCGNKESSYTESSSNGGTPLNTEESVQIPPADGIEVANEDTLTVDLQLDQPLDKYEVVEFVRICLKTIYPMCLYCNHARRIAVNGKSLVLHMIGVHRFTATVDSITAEELHADTIVAKLKSFLPQLEEHFFNANSYCTYGNGVFTKPFNERIYECFQCRVVAATHKELYLHNRKMHLRTAILCFMCRSNFYSFSEILCHICPGAPNKVSVFDVKFRCCLCDLENIPSPFRLMVHLRKKHFACDVCLEDCREQSKLSSHVWKHKLHHLCYRCGIAYRNKQDITKHLFWKHGTESTICKKCLQKKWPHVYHFCIPPQNFVCEVCNLCFTRAMYLRVHKRIHAGDFRYPCIEDDCEEKFVSRRLLLKHAAVHLPPPTVEPEPAEVNQDAERAIEEEAKPEPLAIDLKSEDHIKKEPADETEKKAEKIKSQTDEKKELKVEEKVEEKTLGNTEDCTKLSEPPRKRRKKSKRSKVLLEDLNLAAPNLSESDSSGGDDSDSDSKTRSEIDAMPRVMLSPPSEAEGDEENKGASNNVATEPGKVLQIWQNFLKTQHSPSRESNKTPEPQDPTSTIMYGPMHIALSDHDYCKLYEPPPPPPPPPSALAKGTEFKKPDIDVNSTPESSPIKRKQSKSPRRSSPRRSDASSSSSESSSSSDSSCSCGSNCSCSSSNSGSSSSSSSSEESDSSVATNASAKKRHRKKSERDRLRKRSESNSPLKHMTKQSTSEIVNIDDEGSNAKNIDVQPPSPPKEPLFYESDLETNESETDEEFYDEHPQKLASELLAQKRALLMAQTRLSPSHNYDIVENSRPSTPSLPEEVITDERPKVKVKKKKRDRKATCKGHVHGSLEEQNTPAQNINPELEHQMTATQIAPNTGTTLRNPVTSDASLSLQQYTPAPLSIYAPPPPMVTVTNEQTFTPRPITMRPYGGGGSHHRMSEGSSCSDADGSLKRSKRARRPNKFYGYTSDDENIVNGPPLIIGSRAFKPQPPPQLTWRKEDLPTPSKSILNNKNKVQRTAKTIGNPNTNNIFNSSITSVSTGKKKSRLPLSGSDKSSRKRPMKKKDPNTDQRLPPIPTLKIRPSQIGLNTTRQHEMPHNEGQYNSSDTSSDDDMEPNPIRSVPSSSSSVCTPPTPTLVSNVKLPVLPSQPPPPPTPQTKAFNHRIPPALLPNPDFATLHYFKANNIRYPIRPPAGARQAREGESVYCYCRCPYDEVSEMIACDGENCLIEWFHFECVGIMVAPQGKWFCAECRPKYSEELYPTTAIGQHSNV